MKKLLAILLAFVLALSLCACGAEEAENNNENEEKPSEESGEISISPEIFPEISSNEFDMSKIDFTVDSKFDYNNSDYALANDEAKAAWEEFLTSGDLSAFEHQNLLQKVINADPNFVPAYIEMAKYIIIEAEESENVVIHTAMDALTEGYAATKNPLLLEIKNKMGFEEIKRFVDKAEAALKENNAPEAWTAITEIPEDYRCAEVGRINEILNSFNDAYYYMILGFTAGDANVVHFNLDGTYERVKLNENGIYETGTYEVCQPYSEYDVVFGNFVFVGGYGTYNWVEYDSNYNPREFSLRKDEEGLAKEAFEACANAG